MVHVPVDDSDRRRADSEFRIHMQQHLDDLTKELSEMRMRHERFEFELTARQDKFEAELAENTKATKKLMDVFTAGTIGGMLFKWFVGIGTSILVAWATIKGMHQ